MKNLSLRLVLPLTIISFALITKWWYALPEDAPDTMYTGFPLVWKGTAWHTSLAYQVFMVELFIDLLAYFLFWFLLVYCVNRFWFTIQPPKWATITLCSVSILIIAFYTWIGILFDHAYYFKKPYPMKIVKTGYEFFWQDTQRPQ